MRVTIDPFNDENVEWYDYQPKGKSAPGQRRQLLITTDNFLPRWDGIARFLSEILPRLTESYEITVVCPEYGQVELDNINIVQIPLRRRAFGDYTPAKFSYGKIRELVREADLVFNQSLGPIGVASILASKTMRRPIATYIHSIEWELVPKALAIPPLRGPLVAISKLVARIFYNLCTMLIVPSENIAEKFSWQRIRVMKRIAHLGVDVKKFHPSGDKEQLRERFGFEKDAYIVGYHGRIAHEKNIITLLRGFRRIRVPNKRLLIVGDGIESIKAKLDRFDDVIVTGSKDNPEDYLRVMDVYVQPSFTETTSLTVLEAMATGIPVVSSKVGFITHYIIDHKNGIFFDNTSSHSLAIYLKKLYEDDALRARLGKNARKTIEQSFRWEMTAENVRAALDEI